MRRPKTDSGIQANSAARLSGIKHSLIKLEYVQEDSSDHEHIHPATNDRHLMSKRMSLRCLSELRIDQEVG